MGESLSTVLLAASMFLIGLALGLPSLLLPAKPSPAQGSVRVTITPPSGSPMTITASPTCALIINASGIYSCSGKVGANASVVAPNASIVIG